MELGIFSKTYEGSLDEIFAKMKKDKISATQFNLLSAGLETMPTAVKKEDLDRIVQLSKRYGITLSALSGTFNMIDPDSKRRTDGIQRFKTLCRIAEYLQIPVITLCTGSKNKMNKWAWDADNTGKAAWQDLLDTTEIILSYARDHHIILGVETEASNIINTPQAARKYLDFFQSEYLKIVMDGANLFIPEQILHMQKTLREAFALLGNDIVLAHAKDLGNTRAISFVAAGNGILDFREYLQLLREYHYDGALIMHGLHESQVQDSVAYLKGMLQCHI